MKNEDLCGLIQKGDQDRDRYFSELLKNNSKDFMRWTFEAMADAIKVEVTISPYELMAEALHGFSRAAEVYNSETKASFSAYAETWIKAKVRSYIRKAENGTLPDRLLSSVYEYQRIIGLMREEPKERQKLALTTEQIIEFWTAAQLFLGKKEAPLLAGN